MYPPPSSVPSDPPSSKSSIHSDHIPLQNSPFISDLPEPSLETEFNVPRVTDDESGAYDRSAGVNNSSNQQRKLSRKRGSSASKSSSQTSSFKFGFKRSSSKKKEEHDRVEVVDEVLPEEDVFSEDDLDQIFTQDPPTYEDEFGCDDPVMNGIPMPPPAPPPPPVPSSSIRPGNTRDEYCPPPEDRPAPQPPVSNGPIYPEVEPYIMTEKSKSKKKSSKNHRKSSKQQSNRSSVDSGKSGKRFGIFGKSKTKKSSKVKVIPEEPQEDMMNSELEEKEIEDVLSGLENTIHQAESRYQYSGGTSSVSGFSDVNVQPSDGQDNPVYRGSSSFAGSDLGSPTSPVTNDVFGKGSGYSANDKIYRNSAVSGYSAKDEIYRKSAGSVRSLAKDDERKAAGSVDGKSFILPGEGDDFLPDDLGMFDGGTGDDFIPPPPSGPPPAPPHVASDEFWTPLK